QRNLDSKKLELKEARERLVSLARATGSGNTESLDLNQQSILSEKELLEKQRHELAFRRMELEAQLHALLETQKYRNSSGNQADSNGKAPPEIPVDPQIRAPLPPVPVAQPTNQWVLTDEILEEEYAFDT